MTFGRRLAKAAGWAAAAIAIASGNAVAQSIPDGDRWQVKTSNGTIVSAGGNAQAICKLSKIPSWIHGMTVQHSTSITDSNKLSPRRYPLFDVYSIIEPEVKAATVRLSSEQVPITGGDRVLVYACGCVQTGGVGKTWKSYIHPKGPNSDRLYSGTIGFLDPQPTGMTKIGDYMAKQVFGYVPSRPATVVLGYIDDAYSDNGYWGHDDGTGNQCKGVGAAVVDIAVFHNHP